MNLDELGWNGHFESYYNKVKSENTFPARIIEAQRKMYWIQSDFGIFRAEVSGKMRFTTQLSCDFPVVGDWVTFKLQSKSKLVVIENILPRLNKFSRKEAWKRTNEQVLLANIDTVFIVSGLDNDYNPRRIERYLILARDNAIMPVILLNKSDVCSDIEEKINEVKAIASEAPVHAISALTYVGMDKLDTYMQKGKTVALLGSSGAGKSTIINCFLGENKQQTGTVREHDSRGRHITTHRELITIPEKGMVIDNPGFRELQLWANEQTIGTTFKDIEDLAVNCKFKDCTHTNEPECAISEAITNGVLDNKRFASYLKLKKELIHLSLRKDQKLRSIKNEPRKKISKLIKHIQNHNKKNRYK